MRLRPFIFAVGLSLFAIQSNVQAKVVATFPYDMTHWAESADGNWIYATVQSQNSVAVINAHTLQSTLVGIGSDPTGLALSSDGSTLYVADDGSNFLGVMSTATNTVESPIPLGSGVNPYDVQAGTNNRLWVLTGGPNTPGVIEQINATTGASTGPNAGGSYDGDIRISPDGNTLYYGNYGLSPSSEAKFNVSGPTPSTLWTASLGGNGQEVQLSHDGTLIAFPEGGQSTSIFQTSSMLALGTIPGGAPMTFSANDSVAYYNPFLSNSINVVSLTTYLQTGSLSAAFEPFNMFASNDGNYLFVDEKVSGSSWETQVFAVPEPGTLSIVGLAVIVLLKRYDVRRTSRF